MRKFAIWVVIASLVYLAWWSLHGRQPVALWHRGGSHAFWPGFDLVLASIISWTPLVADYTRFSRTRRDGFVGAGSATSCRPCRSFALGAVIALSRHISDAPGLLTAVAAGGAASLLALLALTVDESDEAFANVYSGAVSLQNLIPRVPQRILVGGVAAIATVGALVVDLRNYQPFLYLLGSFFVPLFAVLLADWLLSGRHYSRDDVFRVPELRARDDRRLADRLLRLPVALPAGTVVVDEPRRAHEPARSALGRSVAAELPGRVRARRPRTRTLRGGPYWRARDRADREPLARRPAGRRSSGRGRLVPRRSRAAAAARAGAGRRALRHERPRRAAPAARPARNTRPLRPGQVDRHVRVLLQRRPA